MGAFTFSIELTNTRRARVHLLFPNENTEQTTKILHPFFYVIAELRAGPSQRGLK